MAIGKITTEAQLEQFIRDALETELGKATAVRNVIHEGTASPENVVTAPVGHVYLRRDGGATTTLYVKESGTGNTGWTAK